MEIQCRFPTSDVDNTHPVGISHFISRGHIVWTTPIPWVTSCGEHIPWIQYPVDYMYPRVIYIPWVMTYPVGVFSSTDEGNVWGIEDVIKFVSLSHCYCGPSFDIEYLFSICG